MRRGLFHLPSVGHIGLLVVLLFLAGTGLSVALAQASETGDGTVFGEVMNGTPGGDVPDDLTVTLHTFSEMTETGVYTTTLSDERGFRFEDVRFETGETVVTRVEYGGVTYVSRFGTVEEDEQEISLPVTIYETTDDPAEVVIAQLHVFVNKMEERVQVGTYAVMSNTGSRTYVGRSDDTTRTTWSVRLPEGAANLQFDTSELGGRFVPLEDGFADTRSIPPGDASVETSFTYELPFDQGMEIEQSFDVPVRAVVLVLPEGDWGLQGTGISSEGALDTQMGAALSYTAGPLGAGEPLAFNLVPRSAASPARVEPSSNGLGLGIAMLVVAGAVIALMWRSSSPDPMPREVRPHVEAIASLDRRFESGQLSEEAYRNKRQSLKRRLRRTLSGDGR